MLLHHKIIFFLLIMDKNNIINMKKVFLPITFYKLFIILLTLYYINKYLQGRSRTKYLFFFGCEELYM
jgi:hypothetical protein